MSRPFASFLSKLFEPGFVLFVIIALSLLSVDLPAEKKAAWLLLFTLLGIVLPYLVVISEVRQGRLRDLDLSERAERPRIFWLATVLWTIALALAIGYHLPRLIIAILVAGLLIAIATTLLTHLLKVSVHASFVTVLVLFLVGRFGPSWWPSALAILLVAWARYTLGKHTIPELLIGILLSGALFILVTKAFGV